MCWRANASPRHPKRPKLLHLIEGKCVPVSHLKDSGSGFLFFTGFHLSHEPGIQVGPFLFFYLFLRPWNANGSTAGFVALTLVWEQRNERHLSESDCLLQKGPKKTGATCHPKAPPQFSRSFRGRMKCLFLLIYPSRLADLPQRGGCLGLPLCLFLILSGLQTSWP